MKRILLLGLLPSVVDLSLYPELTQDKLAAGLRAQEKSLRDLGLDAHWCLFDLGETAEAVILADLQKGPYDVVLFGAGVRTNPALLGLFEKAINLVHAHAPGAKLCFNTQPGDTQEAVLRHVAAG